MTKSSNDSYIGLSDNYHYLSEIFDQYIGRDYYEYIRNRFKNICNDLAPASRHLDIGCGTGDLLEYSYSLGLNVTGIDISPAMIKEAKARLNSNIDITCKSFFDVSNTNWNIITANNDVFNYLAIDHKLEYIFGHLSDLLTNNGVFYGDVVSDYDILENWNDSGHTHTDSKTFRCNVSYKVENHTYPTGLVKRDWEIKENNQWVKKESEIEVLRGISVDEIISASEKNNLSVSLSEFPNGNIEIFIVKH